jgi:hypothetical protein
MTQSHPSIQQVFAVVQDVWPTTGLAYAEDDAHRTWGITRSAHGSGLEHLRPGQRVALSVVSHADFDLVSEYRVIS